MRPWQSHPRIRQAQRKSLRPGGHRTGLMMPAIAMALLVIGMAVLLVFDKLWVDNAQQELRTVAEAASLAAAGELASDDLLSLQDTSSDRVARARQSSATVAQHNLANGSPVSLNTDNGDVLIGRYVYDEQRGEAVLIETAEHPTHVVVTARRPRGMNPMASASDALEGVTRNQLSESATAALSNAVTGVRPSANVNVPAWPLAILENDQTTGRTDTWRQQIELRLGGDNFAYDRSTQQVVIGSDGLPEIIVHAAPIDPDANAQVLSNVHIIDVGTGLYPQQVADQIRTGWTTEHLVAFGGEFTLSAGPFTLDCDAVLAGEPAAALSEMIGSSRICVLYDSYVPGEQGLGRLNVTRLVAVRLMDIRELSNGALACVLQPAVVSTRTAVTGDVIPLGSPSSSDPLLSDGLINPYIYRLFLTR